MSVGTVGLAASLLPTAGPDGAAALVTVIVAVLGGAGFRLGYALARAAAPAPGTIRVRQQHRLVARSWLVGDRRWTPVYYDPALIAGLPARSYPSGRTRTREPIGRLRENPSRPDPDGAARATVASRWPRRLLLDAQPAVGAPVAGLGWVYLTGGGGATFAGATIVAAAFVLWLTALRGTDPS
ncbi:hypothetical protein [Skermania piniformis]|uniref:hypothetical protein n=1 Tax=Skermania pinensis TaxID=39122 RepID=UPI00278C19A7|nr:hypothetical protein [Skermania piniformis]